MCKTHEKDVPTIHRCPCPECRRQPDGAIAREHRAINRIVAGTDERSRRLVAGFLARLYGHGGITLLARITGLDRNSYKAPLSSQFSLGVQHSIGKSVLDVKYVGTQNRHQNFYTETNLADAALLPAFSSSHFEGVAET